MRQYQDQFDNEQAQLLYTRKNIRNKFWRALLASLESTLHIQLLGGNESTIKNVLIATILLLKLLCNNKA